MIEMRLEMRRPIAFVADRVMHYHRATLRAIEARLGEQNIPFHVLSSKDRAGAVGRVAESNPVVGNHQFFRLREFNVGGYMLRQQQGLRDLLNKIDPAVVISMCHSGTITEWQMLHHSARSGVRSVAWQCGYEYHPGRLKRAVLNRFVPLFDFHLCYHSNARQYAISHGAQPSQTLVMHNTIDESKIFPKDTEQARAELIRKHPSLAGKKIVLYVGAVLQEKRLELVFEALSLLHDPDVWFVVVGDGPHLAALKAAYADRKDWLSVGQVIDGVGTYFDAADVFVLPGTGGLAINEAMAHRLPVISSYADGSADDLVIDGLTGYRLREDAGSELSARLRDVLATADSAREMGMRGEERIRGDLSFSRFVDRVTGVLLEQHALAERSVASISGP